MSRRVEFLYLQQEDCVAAGGLDMKGTLEAVERSFYLHGIGEYIQPGKPVIRWGGPETEETTGRIMSMPSFLGGGDHAEELQRRGLGGPVGTSGIKFIPSKPDNPRKRGLPRANAVIIIVDPETLMPACIMDGTLVSAMRTGGASGVAAKYLARDGAEVLGLIGAGVQGLTQVMAIATACPTIRRCKVYDLTREVSDQFGEKLERLGTSLEVEVVDSAEAAIRDSDVVSTATMASDPYVDPDWYASGVLHCEISFWDTPAEALEVMDLVVVDDWYQVKHHGVDVSYRAVRDGVIPKERVRGNLGEIVAGKLPGRSDAGERIFFNPIGLGVHDLSEAHRIYENARRLGLGRTLPLWDEPALG